MSQRLTPTLAAVMANVFFYLQALFFLLGMQAFDNSFEALSEEQFLHGSLWAMNAILFLAITFGPLRSQKRQLLQLGASPDRNDP